VLPSTEHDVFQELEKRDLDSVLVAQPELVERSVTVTVIETVSISATSQTPAVRHHLNREADPQGTSAPNPDAFLQTKPTSTSSASDDSVPNPNAFLQTTSVTLAPNPNAYLQTTSVAFSVPPSAYNDPKNTPEPGAPNREAFLQAEKGYVGDNGKYFLGAYLPTVLAVFFALPWLILAQTVISLEPFYQLSESTGALAESTLTSSLFSLGSAFEALKNRRWTVILGTLLMMLSVAITPIAPETVAIQTIGGCTSGCSGFIRILIPGARVIQGILGIMSILSIVLIVLLLRRRMMVSSDPRSIAGVASLFFDPSVQQDFKEHGVAASQSTLKAALSGSAYRLSFLTRYDGVNLTALIKTRAREISPVQSLYKHDYSSLGWNRIVQQAPRYRGLASILFLLLVGLEALIITYYFTGGETGFENFMSGQGFGVRFLFTSIGIIISSYWDRVFQSKSGLYGSFCNCRR
jgi:hypothetical protein